MRLCLFLSLFSQLAAQCPQVPPANLLPSNAVQDCGSDTGEGAICPFNCTNAFSHTGILSCQSGSWEVDVSNPPQCIEPCYSDNLVLGYGQHAQLLGYLDDFWASPTERVTTTPLLACDVEGAQSCLGAVAGITDIEVFCSRLPGTTECLKAAECCETSAATIRSSIASCADAGRVVENPCVDTRSEQCSASCVPQSLTSDVTVDNCKALQPVPFCMRSEGCCDYWLQGLGLAELAASCRADVAVDVSDACEVGSGLPVVTNEGAQVQVACQVPRFPNTTAVLLEDYECQNSSYTKTSSAASALECLDPPCPLEAHRNGSYQCTLNGQSITLTANAGGTLQVPVGALCNLQCTLSHEWSVPSQQLQCAYVERDFPEIIYADSSQVSSTGVPRMVRRFTNGTMTAAVEQVCEPVDCPFPVVKQPVGLSGNLSGADLDPIDGMLFLDCNGVSQGSVCSPICAAGYMVDALRPEMRCERGHFWGAARCVPMRCLGQPTWTFGSVGSLATWPRPCGNALHGESCEVSCAAGYMRNSSVPAYQCQAGNWTLPSTSPCVESRCMAAPAVSHAGNAQACVNRPHGYECQVPCLPGYVSLGTARCVQGSYVANGQVCVPRAVNQELETKLMDVLLWQVSLVHQPRLVSVQGRARVAAWSLLAMEPEVSPEELAVRVAQEMPELSPRDLALSLAAVASSGVELRAAVAAVGDVLGADNMTEALSSLVAVALRREIAAMDIWGNVSQVLVNAWNGSTTLSLHLSTALRSLLSSPTAAAALAADEDETLSRDFQLHRHFQSLGSGVVARKATAQRQYDLTVGLEQTELENLRLDVLANARELERATVTSEDFQAKLLVALRESDLEVSPSPAAAVAAANAALLTALPWAMDDVAMAVAMTAGKQTRTSCVGTDLSCQRQTLISWMEAGREGAEVASWRAGLLLPAVTSAASAAATALGATRAQRLAMLAGALAAKGVRREELALEVPSATSEEIHSALMLSQVREPTAVLELVQSFGVSGIDLALRLADAATTLTPMEGELALSWLNDVAAGALLRARLSGASSEHLSAAYAAAEQVPSASRSPSTLAARVLFTLPGTTVEVLERCIITRAVSLALGLNSTSAAQAAVFASGIDQAAFSQARDTVTATDLQSLAQQLKPIAGAEATAFQQLSLAFGVALEKLGSWSSAILVVLYMQDAVSNMDVVSQSVPLVMSSAASLSDFVVALLTWLKSKGDYAESHTLLGHSLWLMGENASSPILHSALLHATVSLFQADELLIASRQFSAQSSWLSLAAQRALEAWEADGQNDLVGKVSTQLPDGNVAQFVRTAGVAHFAAAYAGMNATSAAQMVFDTVGNEAPPVAAFAAGFWAQQFAVRSGDLLELSATATAQNLHQQASGRRLATCPPNETACPTASSGCAEPIGLTVGFTCQSHCAAASSVAWPKQCVGFKLGNLCEEPLESCNYIVTQQDVSTHGSGFCVCSSMAASVHAAADNANRLARLMAELQSLQFLAPQAHATVAPLEVVLAAQALTQASPDSDVLKAVLEAVARDRATLTPQQVADAAYRVASLRGFNRSEAALAAVEVSSLDEDQSLAPLADVLFFQGLELEEAKALVLSTAWRLPRISAKALRQAFWRFQQLEDASRQLRRSRLIEQFEGQAAFQVFRAAQAFQGLQVASTNALAAGAQEEDILLYHIASGYSYQQAVHFLGQVNVSADMESAGLRLSEELSFQMPPSVDASWFDTGSIDTSLFSDEAYVPYLQQSLAFVLGLEPAEVDVLGISATLQFLPMSTLDFAIKLEGQNASLVSQRLQNFPSLYDSFLHKLQELLAASNLPVPSIFSNPRIAAKRLEVVSDFQVPLARWVATSGWSACPAVCGSAWQFRDVKCSGNEFACTGAKIPTEQRCEAYLDCSFEWTCPLGGRDASMACGVQFMLAAGILIASVLLFWILVQIVRRFCRCRPRTGQLQLIAKGGQSMKVNFYIVDDKKEVPPGEPAPTEIGQTFTNTTEVEQKTKVVWDIDVLKAQKLEFQEFKMKSIGGQLTDKQERALKRLPGNGQVAHRNTQELLQQCEQEAAVQFANSMKSAKSVKSTKSEATTPRSVKSPRTPASQSAWSQSSRGEMMAPYRSKARVEYFSMSLARWMAAEIHSDYSPGIGYDVMMMSNRGRSTQLRSQVPLQQLRPWILEGELVSAYFEEEWYRGQVSSKSTISNSYVGYSVKVKVHDQDSLLHTQHVWRRFTQGSSVRVFDDALGWVTATVTNEAEMTGPLPVKDEMPNWFEVEVVYETGEEVKVPGYRVQREVMTL